MFESTKDARRVWIASYPRSGNTFLRIILESVFRLPTYSIYFVEGEAHTDPSAEALDEAPKLPRDWRETLGRAEVSNPVLIKTHDAPEDEAPAIFIARDGAAAIHSYFHYHRKYAFEQPSLTEVIAGACQFGSWSDHYRAWQPKTRPNTLLLRYDELVCQPELAISQLAQFLSLKPEQTRLPAFEELQKRLPAFFRRGQNTDYLSEWSPAHLALFNALHAPVMEDLGFPLVPSSGSEIAVKELAASASRLHRMYLDQLGKLGRAVATHREEVARLSREIEDLSGKVQRTFNPLLKTRWVRLGMAFGALPRIEGISVEGTDSCSSPPSAPARGPKSSDGNKQSSSPGLQPGSLSASNGDTF